MGKTKEQVQGRGHYYIWDIEPDEYAKGEFICMESEFEVMEKRHTCVFAEKVKVGNEIRQFETYKSPLFDVDGSVMGTVGVANDVTQERLYQQMIIDNANTDFLTGLYNRRYLGDAFGAQEAFRMVSASIGTAYSEEGEVAVLDTLIEKADALMYKEKRMKKKAW